MPTMPATERYAGVFFAKSTASLWAGFRVVAAVILVESKAGHQSYF